MIYENFTQFQNLLHYQNVILEQGQKEQDDQVGPLGLCHAGLSGHTGLAVATDSFVLIKYPNRSRILSLVADHFRTCGLDNVYESLIVL